MTNNAGVAPTSGKLVICPTPLGNLEDVTLRVLRALRESDVIFAEDTRVTKNLLRHFDVDTPLRSFPEGARASRLRALRGLLLVGKTVAMVSDAGMPGISDPGSELVREARECGAAIDVLPGPSAVLPALVLSGFDVSSFRFDGFPPRKSGERQAYLRELEHERTAVVWFEAPSRVLELLRDVTRVLPRRRIFVLREYTKKFEQQVCGTADNVLREISSPPRGEFTLVLEPGRAERPSVGRDVENAIAFLRKRGLSAKDTTEAIRLATGLAKNDLYRVALKVRSR
jgi:16S rRNA (cytidine1402-2'-O)-methyltransferase